MVSLLGGRLNQHSRIKRNWVVKLNSPAKVESVFVIVCHVDKNILICYNFANEGSGKDAININCNVVIFY